MIQVHQGKSKRWFLGLNPCERDDCVRFGESGLRRIDFQAYWSGDKWVRGLRNAAFFNSESDAYRYLDANLPKIEAPPPPRFVET